MSNFSTWGHPSKTSGPMGGGGSSKSGRPRTGEGGSATYPTSTNEKKRCLRGPYRSLTSPLSMGVQIAIYFVFQTCLDVFTCDTVRTSLDGGGVSSKQFLLGRLWWMTPYLEWEIGWGVQYFNCLQHCVIMCCQVLPSRCAVLQYCVMCCQVLPARCAVLQYCIVLSGTTL